MGSNKLWDEYQEWQSDDYKWVDLTHELSPETPPGTRRQIWRIRTRTDSRTTLAGQRKPLNGWSRRETSDPSDTNRQTRTRATSLLQKAHIHILLSSIFCPQTASRLRS